MIQLHFLRPLGAALAITSSLLWASSAHADEADDAFAAGKAAFVARRFSDAELQYEKAFKLRPSPDIAANLAQTEIELSKKVEAAEHLSYALRLMPASTKPEVRGAMQSTMTELRAKLGELRIESNVAGAELTVTERSVGSSPLSDAVFVEAGEHKVRASADGYAPAEKTVVVSAGRVVEIKLTLTKTGDTGGSTGRPSWPGWLMGGVGLAAAGVGGALIGVGQGKLGDAESLADEIRRAGGNCEPVQGPMSDRCSEGEDAISSSDTTTNAGIGVGVAGGALLVAGIIYLVVPNDASTTPPVASAWITPDSMGLLLHGVF